MSHDEIQEFLKQVEPFRFLGNETLASVARSVTVETHPRGAYILRQEGPPSDTLRVIWQGNVKVSITTADNEEVEIDYRGEGEAFGLLSLIGGDKSRANAVAVEDTVCYRISRETIMQLLDNEAVFTKFFLQSFFHKFLFRTYREIHDRGMFCSSGDKVLFTTPLGELISRDVVTAEENITIREAAEVMSRHRISSLVLSDRDGIPTGIVTDRDLREKVVARERSPRDPVSSVMSGVLIKADAREYCFEALLKMVHYNIHHVLVVDQGSLKGMVTNHDLMMLQGISPLSLEREIECQDSVGGLAAAAQKINRVIGLLMRENVQPGHVTRIITEINDRLARKILGITERRLGRPPVPYCWIVFGSEGRKEQTLRTDQDNAIIYEDPVTEDQAAAAAEYFAVLAGQMKDALNACGVHPCTADFMASNQKWRQPLRRWKDYFSGWVRGESPDAMLFPHIFFDFRPLFGNIGLAQVLRDHLDARIREEKLFLVSMASAVVKSSPPLGLLGNLKLKIKDGREVIDIKEQGLSLIVDAVRLAALETGIQGTATLERIEELKARQHPVVIRHGRELKEAFDFLMSLRLRHQVEQMQAGRDPDNWISPGQLSSFERKTLKETFRLIQKIHDRIIEKYKPLILAKL